MAEFLHTRDMEGTARKLADRYPRLFIRNKLNLWNPIRLRRSNLADLHPAIVLNPPEFNSELLKWNQDGGTLIYERSYQKDEDVAAHNAQLVCECPLSVAELNAFAEGTQDMAVIYRPPNWDEHRRNVHDLYPTAGLCKQFFEKAQSSAEDSALENALMLPEGFQVCSDEAMRGHLGITSAQLWKVRNTTLRKRDYRFITQVILRHVPDDKQLADVYYFIKRECPVIDNKHLILGSMLNKATTFWKLALRNLVRRGSIAKKDTLFCYFLQGLPPKWDRIEKDHVDAKQRLADVIRLVESSVEFT